MWPAIQEHLITWKRNEKQKLPFVSTVWRNLVVQQFAKKYQTKDILEDLSRCLDKDYSLFGTEIFKRTTKVCGHELLLGFDIIWGESYLFFIKHYFASNKEWVDMAIQKSGEKYKVQGIFHSCRSCKYWNYKIDFILHVKNNNQ